MDQEAIKVERSPARCPYCKDALEDLEKIVACSACGARHHLACHTENAARCATCASTAVLAPRGAARAGGGPHVPPAGSAIAVSRVGDAIEYSWPVPETNATLGMLLLFFSCIGAPIALWLLLRSGLPKPSGPRLARLVLGPRGLQLFGPGAEAYRLAASRDEIGAVRATFDVAAGSRLTYDVGIKRLEVSEAGRLSDPEIDWLAQEIDAWKRDA